MSHKHTTQGLVSHFCRIFLLYKPLPISFIVWTVDKLCGFERIFYTQSMQYSFPPKKVRLQTTATFNFKACQASRQKSLIKCHWKMLLLNMQETNEQIWTLRCDKSCIVCVMTFTTRWKHEQEAINLNFTFSFSLLMRNFLPHTHSPPQPSTTTLVCEIKRRIWGFYCK